MEQSVVETFSSVPRLPAWSFLRLIHGGVLPPPHSPRLARLRRASSGLRFPPLISREKHSGLPPVTQKRPQSHALSISAAGVSPHRLLEDEKINIYANTFERYQFVTIVDHKKGRSCMLDQQICRNWGMFGQSSAGVRTIHHPIPGIKSRNVYTPEKGFLF